MRYAPRIVALCSALVILFSLCAPLTAATPELISAKPFDVKVTNGVVDVNFTLALSEVTSYPVRITAICCSTEELLYEGTLSEGAYRLSAPLTKISGRGELKVILKTRVTNRTDKGNESFSIYLKWQGPM